MIIIHYFLTYKPYFSNIFIAHTKIHNLFFILIGNLFFFYFSRKNLNKFNLSKNLFFLAIIFLIIFISLLIKKNHDDFPYYHFSYTYNLTQNSLDFGIGKINHGFRTPSSIFYLNSLFYLPLADYYLFNFSSAYVIGFSNLILLRKIFNLNLNWITYKKNLTSTNFLSLIIFIFINIFFYRLSEHGTDRSAQILIFILFIYFLKIFQNRLYTKEDFYFVYILVGLIISFKSFYFLYLIFGIPFFIYVYENEKSFYMFLKVLFLT